MRRSLSLQKLDEIGQAELRAPFLRDEQDMFQDTSNADFNFAQPASDIGRIITPPKSPRRSPRRPKSHLEARPGCSAGTCAASELKKSKGAPQLEIPRGTTDSAPKRVRRRTVYGRELQGDGRRCSLAVLPPPPLRSPHVALRTSSEEGLWGTATGRPPACAPLSPGPALNLKPGPASGAPSPPTPTAAASPHSSFSKSNPPAPQAHRRHSFQARAASPGLGLRCAVSGWELRMASNCGEEGGSMPSSASAIGCASPLSFSSDSASVLGRSLTSHRKSLQGGCSTIFSDIDTGFDRWMWWFLVAVCTLTSLIILATHEPRSSSSGLPSARSLCRASESAPLAAPREPHPCALRPPRFQ